MYTAKTYKIWWADSPEEFYIGGTKSTLSKRMAKHRGACKAGVCKSVLYDVMKDKGSDFMYVLLGSKLVIDKDEQRQFEQSWIDDLKPSLNIRRAFASITVCECGGKYKHENHRLEHIEGGRHRAYFHLIQPNIIPRNMKGVRDGKNGERLLLTVQALENNQRPISTTILRSYGYGGKCVREYYVSQNQTGGNPPL